jgi:hypothetical protein
MNLNRNWGVGLQLAALQSAGDKGNMTNHLVQVRDYACQVWIVWIVCLGSKQNVRGPGVDCLVGAVNKMYGGPISSLS